METFTLPPTRVVGMVYRGNNPMDVPPVWERLIPREGEIAIQGECYGVCRTPDESGAFEYLAGFESQGDVPEGMEAWDLPGGEYYSVPLAGLHEIHQAFATHMKHSSLPTLEHYPEGFPENPAMSIHFPVA